MNDGQTGSAPNPDSQANPSAAPRNDPAPAAPETNAAPAAPAAQTAAAAAASQEGGDPLDAVLPQTPEEAAQFGAEGTDKDGDIPPEEQTPETDGPVVVDIPDGFEMDQPVMDEFHAIVNDGGVSKETAQKLFDMYTAERDKLVGAFEKGYVDQAANVNAEWAAKCRNDPEFGGERFEESCNYVIAAIRRFVPGQEEQAEFLDYINRTNQRNAHPLWRLLARAGRMTGEAGPVASDASNPAAEKSLAQRLFGNMPPA